MENTSVHSLADEISPLTLAFVGDGVYDLLVREYLVRKANRSVGELNKIKVSLVNCKSQAQFAKILMPELTEKELAVYKRGRNSDAKQREQEQTNRQDTVFSLHTFVFSAVRQ